MQSSKVWLITGASKGFGLQLAIEMLRGDMVAYKAVSHGTDFA